MTYKAKVAVCSDIRTKRSSQSECHVEIWMLNLVVGKETARLWKVNITKTTAKQWWTDNDGGKCKYWEKNLSLSICTPKISHVMARDRTWATAGKGRRLTASVMAQPRKTWVHIHNISKLSSHRIENISYLYYKGHLLIIFKPEHMNTFCGQYVVY